MAKKNTTPTITHTEILCFAIAHLDSKIRDYQEKLEEYPAGHPAIEMLEGMIAPLAEKREAVAHLYNLETGVEYN